MKKYWKSILGSILIVCFSIFLSMSVGINHLYHLAFKPNDLHHPIVTDKFEFFSENYSKEYLLKPKYRDIYELILEFPPNTIPSGWDKKNKKYHFSGALKAELFHGSQKINEKIITEFNSAYYQDNDLKYYKSISLHKFKLPAKGWKLREAKLKITALKPDKFLEKHKENALLKVRVSTLP